MSAGGRVTNFQRMVQAELDASGLSYEIRCGKKHRKLYIEGRMVMVFSHGSAVTKDIGQVKSVIRRSKRGQA